LCTSAILGPFSEFIHCPSRRTKWGKIVRSVVRIPVILSETPLYEILIVTAGKKPKRVAVQQRIRVDIQIGINASFSF